MNVYFCPVINRNKLIASTCQYNYDDLLIQGELCVDVNDYKRKYGNVWCWPNLSRRLLGISRNRFKQLIDEGLLVSVQKEDSPYHYFKLGDLLKLREYRGMSHYRNKRGSKALMVLEDEVCELLNEAFSDPCRRLVIKGDPNAKEA